jgi:YHS domain-containing protein
MKTIALLFVAMAALGGACSRASSNAPSTSEVNAAALTRVADPSQVCMVNNTFMGAPQIPVEVDGRTYYGCCPACKDRLANDPTSRVAVDPVTGEQIDKAKAVIAYDHDRKVFYFASEDSLRKYKE